MKAQLISPTEVPAHSQKTIQQSLQVPQPQFWSPETPRLYQARTTLRDAAATVVDEYETTFGIRTFRWDPNEGFFLNGKHVEIAGTCNHQDHAGLGTALPDRVHWFRIEKLREMGSNAYRTAHNPPTPELLDACDKLGMMVWDETRRFDDSPLGLAELEAMVRRDRNHPSIILWSIGNEEPLQADANAGVRIATSMQNLVHRLDPSRPVTYANNGSNSWGRAVSAMIDIMGFNYSNGGQPDRYHSSLPAKPCVGSEDAVTRSTRGVYADDANACFVSSYCDNKQTSATRRSIIGSISWLARGSQACSSGPVLIIAASPFPTGSGLIPTRTASWTPAGFRKTISIIIRHAGRTSRWCISCRTGTGRARRARKSKSAATATAMPWNCP